MPNGRPRVARPVVGSMRAKLTTDPAGHFTVVSTGLCLVELAPDPMHENYRLRAEVKHLRCNHRIGAVGLYVAHRATLGQPNAVHQFLAIGFNDVVDDARDFDDVIAKLQVVGPADRPQGNRLLVQPTVFAGSEAREDSRAGVGGIRARLFTPHGGEDGPWRRLTVEVTPKGVRVFWGDDESASELLAGPINDDLAVALRMERARGAKAEYLPRGGLGLYVERCDAAFRNVVIEKLPP